MVKVGGIIGMTKTITNRAGDQMMFLRLDDLQSGVEVVVVANVYAEHRELLREDAMVIIEGRVDQKSESETKIVARTVIPFVPEPGGEEDRVILDEQGFVRVDADRFLHHHLDDLRRLIGDHRGEARMIVEMRTTDGPLRLKFGEEFRVDAEDRTLVASLKSMFGATAVTA